MLRSKLITRVRSEKAIIWTSEIGGRGVNLKLGDVSPKGIPG